MSYHILKVIEFASLAHAKEMRKSGHGRKAIPYINHPIEVSTMILRAIESSPSFVMGLPDFNTEDTLAAAILHDVIENTSFIRKDIEALTNKNVASILDDVTDDPDMPQDTYKRKAIQAKKAESFGAQSTNVKVSDQLSNIRSLINLRPSWSANKITSYLEGASKIVESAPQRFVIPMLFEEYYKAVDELTTLLDTGEYYK
jgi:GTP pyrophosphokinase